MYDADVNAAFATHADGRLYFPWGFGKGYVVPDGLTELRLRGLERRLSASATFALALAFLTDLPIQLNAAVIAILLGVHVLSVRQAVRGLVPAPVRRTWFQAFTARAIERGWAHHTAILMLCVFMVAAGLALLPRPPRASYRMLVAWTGIWGVMLAAAIASAIVKHRAISGPRSRL